MLLAATLVGCSQKIDPPVHPSSTPTECIRTDKDFNLITTITLQNGETQTTGNLSAAIFLGSVNEEIEKASKKPNNYVIPDNMSPFIDIRKNGKVVRKVNNINHVMGIQQNPTCKPSDLTKEQVDQLRKEYNLSGGDNSTTTPNNAATRQKDDKGW